MAKDGDLLGVFPASSFRLYARLGQPGLTIPVESRAGRGPGAEEPPLLGRAGGVELKPDLQMRCDGGPDAGGDGRGVGVSVDQAKAGMPGRKVQEPGAGLLLEGEAHILEPQFPPGAGGGAGQALLRVKVEEEREIWFNPDHQVMQTVDGRRKIAPGDALKDAG